MHVRTRWRMFTVTEDDPAARLGGQYILGARDCK